MFPVVAVPGYFLFVLIRSCILNDIMLIRDSKMNTMSLSGIFFCMDPWSFCLICTQTKIVPVSAHL